MKEFGIRFKCEPDGDGCGMTRDPDQKIMAERVSVGETWLYFFGPPRDNWPEEPVAIVRAAAVLSVSVTSKG